MLNGTRLAIAAAIVFGTAFAVQAGSKHHGPADVGPQGQPLAGPYAWTGVPPDARRYGNSAYAYGGYGYGAYAGVRYPTIDRCVIGRPDRPEQAIQDRFYLESNGANC